jgi:hypothetical protein
LAPRAVPASAPEAAPLDAQFIEQLRAEHDIAVLAALALPDLSLRRQRALMEDHPVDSELILHLAKAKGKERLFDRHQYPPSVGEHGENPLCLMITIQSQTQVCTPHRFGLWDVCRPELNVTNRNARVQHRILPIRTILALGRL